MDPEVLLYSAVDAMQAAMLLPALEAQGITARQAYGQISTAFDGVPARACSIAIYVAQSELEPGRLVIRESLSSMREGRPESAAWVCPACSEQNAPAFQVCWACGREQSA